MAPSAITTSPPLTSTKPIITKKDRGYLDTTNDLVADYAETEVRGATDILTSQATRAEPFGDWRDEFFTKGYHVVKGAVPRARAEAYSRRMLDWFDKFPFGFDVNDKSTWVQEHLPMMMKGGVIFNYCAGHEAWAWELRSEPGVIEPFAKLWGTDELLVSFDAPNITLPGRIDVPWAPWPHVDQSPTRKGLVCVQGIINLSPAGPKDGGLQLYQGSSELFEQFFVEHPLQAKPEGAPGQVDWYGFSAEDVAWFEARGCTLLKIDAEPGDLIIWDSRTVHQSVLPESEQIRTILYATYAPASLATAEDLRLKRELFERFEGSTHWPHVNIWGQGKAVRDGKPCPGERDEPLEKPVLTDTVLKLAGVKPY
ncbi:hypothetical protein B0T19DRAFT_455480 [Cercophora scortea]|uniref:Phytanoyl-CoA dioxygenase n=1 Tax=Cercophora scortea TaxID=314031 RepID=A0AAE0J5Z6_9PEZI|nr:hypothetical protein B0T19DRAFT_455480 [Cercophora scortea]